MSLPFYLKMQVRIFLPPALKGRNGAKHAR